VIRKLTLNVVVDQVCNFRQPVRTLTPGYTGSFGGI
jgi:hypothetical protein